MRKTQFLRPLLIATVGLCILLLLSWLPGLFRSQAALASSFVVGSDPVDGSTISVPPKLVRIFFNTPISSASTATVYYGLEYRVMNAGHSWIASNNPQELDTPLLAQLPEGSYTVRWTALSTTDGRATHGVIGFNIGHSSTGLPGQVILGPSTSNILPQLSSLGILAIAWDWLVMAALALWIGILVMESIVLADGRDDSGVRMTRDLRDPEERSNIDQSSEREESVVRENVNVGTGLAPVPTFTFSLVAQVRKQSLPLQWLCLAALCVGEIINLILRATLYTQAFNTSGIDPTAIRALIFDTTYGHLWLVRITLIGLALVFLGWTNCSLKRTSPGVRNTAGARTKVKTNYSYIMLTLAGCIVFTLSLSEDVTQLAQAHASAVILNWLFLIAQGIWFGGAAYLGFVLLPLLPALEPELHARSLVTLIRRSIPLLAGSIGVLLVSGLFLTETSLSSVQQLVTDPFGRALLVKIMLVAVMLLVSIYALFFLTPQLRRQVVLLHVVNPELPARRTRQAALERNESHLILLMKSLAFLGAGALLCAAFMSFFAPPIVFPAINYTSGSNTSTGSTTTNTGAIQTKQVGDLTVHVQVTPARVNYDNTVIVTMSDSNGNPITNAQLRININMLTMDMGTASATINGGNPTYVAVFKKGKSFTMAGLWDIALNIQRPSRAPVQVSFQVPFNA
ncbi:MAG TPA: copper resistance protein CopC [Ktedonobacteraceae bacterium]|nr:copper resistance protein CopC [Ktedonobacteraceae bacterium]